MRTPQEKTQAPFIINPEAKKRLLPVVTRKTMKAHPEGAKI
jgi:hypothetical protein